MKKSDQIVISKSTLFKILGITIGFILLVLLAFAASNKTENYKEQTEEEKLDDEDLYEEAVKNSAEVKDEERKSPKQINVDEYLELYNSSGKKIVLFSRPTCHYCQIATPIIENIIYEYKVDINYINTDELGDDGSAEIVKSDDYFSEGYGTPLLLVVGDGEIKDKIEGLTTKKGYLNFLKKYEFVR